MNRLAIAFTSFIGSLGFALAMAYLLLVVRAFQPGSSAVTEFLVGTGDSELKFGFLLFAVPYLLLMLHLWLRIRLGEWLLARGDLDAAETYSRKRMKPTLLRAAKEAVAHRNVVARILMRRGEYDAAWELLSAAKKVGRTDPWSAEHRRWKLEVALRRENLVDANRVADESTSVKVRGPQAAALHACIAELRTREADASGARAAIESARWASEKPSARVALAKALAVQRFGGEPDELTEALAGLELARAWLEDVPGAEGELRAVEAELLVALGRREEAAVALGSFDDGWDARARWRWSQHRDEEADE